MANELESKVNEENCYRQRCGWFHIRPSFIQWLDSSKSLLFFLCAYFIANSAVINGIYSASISTIEKRFQLSSSQMGMVTSIYDIAALLFIGPVSYFGTRNKPRALGLGMLAMGIGYVIFISPHLIASPYEPDLLTAKVSSNATSNLLCIPGHVNKDTKPCNEQIGDEIYYMMFLMGMFVAGAGCSPMISIGTPYLDESVSPKTSPIYIGIFQSSGIIAVIAGFILVSVFLNMFVHPGQHVNISRKSESWIGAWWLGFAIGAAFSLIISIFLFAFPKQLRKTNYNNKDTKNTVEEQLDKNENRMIVQSGLRELPGVLKSLLIENPTFLFTSIGVSLASFVTSSSVAFSPKMALFQFRMTASQISLYMSVTAVPGAILGCLAGSYIHKRLGLTTVGALKMIVAISIVSLATGSYSFIYCKNYPIEDLNANQATSLSTSCKANCSCESNTFAPVCVANKTYISPCHAGCTLKSSIKGYSNCSCLLNATNVRIKQHDAISGPCPSSCGVLPHIYFLVSFFDSFINLMALTPCTMVTLRCVPLHLRSFAMGIQWMMVRVFGSIPGPILVGYVIDGCCTFWNKICMNSKGSCRVYDNKTLAINTGLIFISIRVLIMTCFIITLIFHVKSKRQKQIEVELIDFFSSVQT